VRSLQGGKCSLRDAGAQFNSQSIRQISAAVRKLEESGAADTLREAALEEEASRVAGTPALGETAELTPKSRYKAGYKVATKARSEGATLEAARDAALKIAGAAPSIETIRSCAKPGESPPPKGRKPPMGKDAELFLARAVKACAAKKIPLFKDGIVNGAKAIIAAHPWMAKHFGKEGPGNKWYYRWLKAHDLEGAHIRPIETSRAQWCTPANLKAWYKVVEDLLVENGIAVRNPDYDENKPFDEPIFILYPQYIGEWDEARFLLEQAKDTGKTTQDKRVVPKFKKQSTSSARPTKRQKHGQCEALAVKTSRAFTGCGGSLANGIDLPALFIIAAEGLKEEWVKSDGPTSRMWDQSINAFAPAMCTANTKGGMKKSLTGDYLLKAFSICWRIEDRPLHPDPEKAAKGVRVRPVALGDGFEDHWADDTLNACDVLQFDLQLRVPHSSQLTQGCDTDNFPIVKKQFRKRKAERVIHNLMKKKKNKLTFDYSDCMPTVKNPWQYGFREEICKLAWKHIGIYPFNRGVYWDLFLEQAIIKETVDDAADEGFNLEAVDWTVMFGDNFSDDEEEEEDGDMESSEPKGRLTSGDIAFNGPANNAVNRALIKAKKDTIKAKAVEKAARKEHKGLEHVKVRQELLAKAESAEEKLALKAPSMGCMSMKSSLFCSNEVMKPV
jgi:hypothetical protein